MKNLNHWRLVARQQRVCLARSKLDHQVTIEMLWSSSLCWCWCWCWWSWSCWWWWWFRRNQTLIKPSTSGKKYYKEIEIIIDDQFGIALHFIALHYFLKFHKYLSSYLNSPQEVLSFWGRVQLSTHLLQRLENCTPPKTALGTFVTNMSKWVKVVWAKRNYWTQPEVCLNLPDLLPPVQGFRGLVGTPPVWSGHNNVDDLWWVEK